MARAPGLLVEGWVNAKDGNSFALHHAYRADLAVRFASDVANDRTSLSSAANSNAELFEIPQEYRVADFDLTKVDNDWLTLLSKNFNVSTSQHAKDAVIRGGHHQITPTEHMFVAGLIPNAVLIGDPKKHSANSVRFSSKPAPLNPADFTTVTYWRVRVQNSPSDPTRGGGLTGEYWVNAQTGEVETIYTRIDEATREVEF